MHAAYAASASAFCKGAAAPLLPLPPPLPLLLLIMAGDVLPFADAEATLPPRGSVELGAFHRMP